MQKLKDKSQSPLDIDKIGYQPVSLSFGDKFTAFAIRLFNRQAYWFSEKMPGLREDILKSNMTQSPIGHVSTVLFFAIIGIIPGIVGVLLFALTGFIFGLALLPVPALILLVGLFSPKMGQGSRANALDQELPFVVGYITTLTGGGIAPVTTLRRLSKENLYPAAAKEAKRILMDVDVFGMDPISALEKAARYNPNKAFSDFIGGYTSVLKTGGDVVHYMEAKLKDIFTYRAIKTKAAAEFIGTIAEAYIAITVILGISFFVLFSIQSILGSGGFGGGGGDTGGLTSIIIFSVVFIPIISMFFIYVCHGAQPKEPVTNYMPYLVFSGSLFAVPVFMALPVGLPFYTTLGLGLIISVIPAAYVQLKDVRHRKGVETMLPNFLRDIAEVRKTGLAPERCIEMLANRKYGLLSKFVSGMSSQLSWGVPLREVMMNFQRSVKSWVTKAFAFLLLEVVDVGGGTVRMFNSLAEFTQKISEIEKERKGMLRPYIFIPYFGSVMIMVTTIMMLFFLTTPLVGGSSTTQVGFQLGAEKELITTVLLSGGLVQGWVMGFVAGKMGEGSIAAGFKHAGALAAISLITIYISSIFFMA